MEREKGYMDLGLFRKIIDDASRIRVKRVHLYLHGEPLLHPQLIEMIRYVKLKNIGLQIITNGTLFNQRIIEAILHSRVDSADHIIISMLGYSKEVHEMIMKGAKHDLVLKNIFDFLNLRRSHKVNGPILETIFYRMPENEKEEAFFIDKWSRIFDHVRHGGKISEQFARYKSEDNSVPVRNRTCKNLWERMTIFWNGDVTTCCADLDGNYILGNLKEKSIRDIWNSNQLLLIKKLHQEKHFHKLPFCLKCDW